MPSSQIQAANTGNSAPSNQPTSVANKPLPSKLPPPPPPPPKDTRLAPQPPPPPLPPPPPRTIGQLTSQTSLNSNQLCIGANGSGTVLNNGSSMNSLNSTGRCSHFQTNLPYSNSNNHNQRGFTRHGDCSSRSSVSSHRSLGEHHHHAHTVPSNNNSLTSGFVTGSCGHQPNCALAVTNLQHNHQNSGTISDNESCNLSYNSENRNPCQFVRAVGTNSGGNSSNGGYCNIHHSHSNQPFKLCQNQIGNSNNNSNNIRLNGANPSSTRNNNSFLSNTESAIPASNGCCSNNDLNRAYFPGSFPHHHHHHHHHSHHNFELSPDSSLSSLPIDNGNMSSHRCNLSVQSNAPPSLHPNIIGEPQHRPMIAHQTNCHLHRACAHHHQANCFNHHANINGHVQQPQGHTCSHVHNDPVHHECSASNVITCKCCPASVDMNNHQRCQAGSTINSCPESTNNNNNETILTTAHTHNLSNSSTTTHTSNVAVKHQPQFHRPMLSRGGRSSSSQHYEHYGLSSAASTSSATASLSSYHPVAGHDDLTPLYPHSNYKMHQPLPPPPPPPPKSRPASPPHQMFNNVTVMMQQFVGQPQTFQPQQQQQQQHQQQPQLLHPEPPPPLPPAFPQITTTSNHNSIVPPLPPRPISPNASSCSTQITTVRTSPSLQNQPIAHRITTQVFPNNDVPPPLPPMHPGSRTQPLINSTMTKIQNINGDNAVNNTTTATNLVNLNYSRGGIVTEAERKTEVLTKQVELELEQQQKTGEPHGVCRKCGDKVMPSQEACEAMNQIYHVSCFICCECGRTLLNKNFYPVGDKVYCEEDFKYTGHMQALKKCAECSQPIFDMILPAIGKSYHPKCFKCCICGNCLDGVPFTIDSKSKIYCVEDYQNLYSPKCASCGKTIRPIDGTNETVRVHSMGKDYHIDCFCCEDCGLQLTDEEPSRSFPLDNHLLCKQCHISRLSKMQAALSLR